MTENLAGRGGEGLAGLVAKWREAVRQMEKWPELQSDACVLKTCTEQLETALEAAAPAGTAHELKFPELKHQGSPIVGMDYDHKLTVITTELFEQLVEYGAALATPSPQAPPSRQGAGGK